jgi:hypothetical protein
LLLLKLKVWELSGGLALRVTRGLLEHKVVGNWSLRNRNLLCPLSIWRVNMSGERRLFVLRLGCDLYLLLITHQRFVLGACSCVIELFKLVREDSIVLFFRIVDPWFSFLCQTSRRLLFCWYRWRLRRDNIFQLCLFMHFVLLFGGLVIISWSLAWRDNLELIVLELLFIAFLTIDRSINVSWLIN